MKFNKNKRIFLAMYTAMMSAVMLTGFASSTEAQEQSAVEAEVSTEPSDQEETLDDTQSAGDVGTDRQREGGGRSGSSGTGRSSGCTAGSRKRIAGIPDLL